MRRISAWCLALSCVLAAGPTRSQEAPTAPDRDLNILLTNDDGMDAIGIQTLKEALREAGHRVTVVAPSSNRSGSSAAMTFGPITVKTVRPGEYAADAPPAACAVLGMTAFADADDPFDLLVSGINLGSNPGAATGISGTVGATTIAALGMGTGLPGIAFSTPEPRVDPSDSAFREHFENVAEFAVRLIHQLVAKPLEGGALLQPGTRLNVNYPLREPPDIAGVRVAVQGHGNAFALRFEEIQPGVYAAKFAAVESGPPSPGSDVEALEQGYIAVVHLDADYTAPPELIRQTRHRLAGLTAQEED